MKIMKLKGHLSLLGSFLKEGHTQSNDLDDTIKRYLTHDNPRLCELKKAYRSTQQASSLWESDVWENRINLRCFRREDDYLSQGYRRGSISKYLATTAYITGRYGEVILDQFDEDSLFGVKLWNIGADRQISRDLLDSILEIKFLEETIGAASLQEMRVLDIGAGYGRFAHRFTKAYPQSRICCIDAVATSTFLCEFYLRFRFPEKSPTVLTYLQKNTISKGTIDLACNIHSWSECTLESIQDWIQILAAGKTKYIFIVPHQRTLSSMEKDGSKKVYEQLLLSHGYRLARMRPKFEVDFLQMDAGVFPAYYYLFELHA